MDALQHTGSRNRKLTDEQVVHVHELAVQVLEEIGSRVLCSEALDILCTIGCDISDTNRVRIPRRLVDEAIERAPETIEVFDREGERALTLETDACYYGTGSDCLYTIDLDSGRHRLCTERDVADLARFCDALPNMDFVMSFGIANDAPRGGNFVHQYRAMLVNTAKPTIVTAHGCNDMRTIIRMAAEAVGGPESVRSRPPLILYSEPLSPLVHTDMGVAKALLCCEWDIPFIYIGSPMMGASGPVTIEGILVQTVAESLAGLVIFQNKKPGAKFIFGGDAAAMDMRHSIFSYGSPELNVLNAALADMAHHYRLPFFCIAGSTDAKTLDAQAGCEYALSLLTATLNGCNLIHDCGYLESGLTSSFESVLLSDEIAAMVKYMLRSLQFTDLTVPMDVMNRVGPGGTFLTEEHTSSMFRETLWFPRFLSREKLDDWTRSGSKDIRQVLNERARDIFKDHQPRCLTDATRKAIDRLVAAHASDV